MGATNNYLNRDLAHHCGPHDGPEAQEMPEGWELELGNWAKDDESIFDQMWPTSHVEGEKFLTAIDDVIQAFLLGTDPRSHELAPARKLLALIAEKKALDAWQEKLERK
jgi:hypothetical protein